MSDLIERARRRAGEGASVAYLLLQGDARRPLLADESVDCVVTDPPYGTRVDRDGYGRRQLWEGKRHVAGDDSLETMRFGMSQAYAALKPNSWAAVFCSPKLHRQSIEACEAAGFRHAGEFVWDKKAPGLGGGIRYQHENILLMAKGRPSGKASVPSVLRFFNRDANSATAHASKKPEALYRVLIRYCCPEGGIVFDPFAGSGTAVLAGVAIGRRVIGAELVDSEIENARRRLERPHAPVPRPGREEPMPLFDGAAQPP